MNWKVRVTKSVLKHLKKVPRKDADRIRKVLIVLAQDPYQGDVEKMQGEESNWRRRVGSYRISYEISVSEKIVNVFRIKRRTSKSY